MEKLANLKWYFALPIWYAITTTATFVIWFGLSQAMGGPEDVFTNPVTSLKFASLMAIPFTAMALLMTSMSNKSQKFWDYSKEVQALIDKAETQEELGSIYKNEFQTLKDLAQGGPHGTELTKQYTILQTKYKYVK
jgi:hypothetical protein